MACGMWLVICDAVYGLVDGMPESDVVKGGNIHCLLMMKFLVNIVTVFSTSSSFISSCGPG